MNQTGASDVDFNLLIILMVLHFSIVICTSCCPLLCYRSSVKACLPALAPFTSGYAPKHLQLLTTPPAFNPHVLLLRCLLSLLSHASGPPYFRSCCSVWTRSRPPPFQVIKYLIHSAHVLDLCSLSCCQFKKLWFSTVASQLKYTWV